MAENRVLGEQLGKKRLRFTDDQRRSLAMKAKAGKIALAAPEKPAAPRRLARVLERYWE